MRHWKPSSYVCCTPPFNVSRRRYIIYYIKNKQWTKLTKFVVLCILRETRIYFSSTSRWSAAAGAAATVAVRASRFVRCQNKHAFKISHCTVYCFTADAKLVLEITQKEPMNVSPGNSVCQSPTDLFMPEEICSYLCSRCRRRRRRPAHEKTSCED